MPIVPLMISRKLPLRNTCEYYKEILSEEQFLKCKEYETLQNNHTDQMLIFFFIIFIIFIIFLSNKQSCKSNVK